MLSEMEKLYEGYSKAVKLVMGEARRGQLKGVHGPVAGLIHVPDRYAAVYYTHLDVYKRQPCAPTSWRTRWGF